MQFLSVPVYRSPEFYPQVPVVKGKSAVFFKHSVSFSNQGGDSPSPGHLLGTIVIPLAPPAVSNQQIQYPKEVALGDFSTCLFKTYCLCFRFLLKIELCYLWYMNILGLSTLEQRMNTWVPASDLGVIPQAFLIAISLLLWSHVWCIYNSKYFSSFYIYIFHLHFSTETTTLKNI